MEIFPEDEHSSLFLKVLRPELGHEQIRMKISKLYTDGTGMISGVQICNRFRP